MKIQDKIISILCNFLLTTIKIKPKSDQTISSDKIKSLFKNKGCKDIFIGDKSYYPCFFKDIENFLNLNTIDKRKYIPEKHDCDNFSWSLMGKASYILQGFAFGIVWAHTPTGNHALNFFIDNDNKIWYVEPQTDEIFQNTKFKPYLVLI